MSTLGSSSNGVRRTPSKPSVSNFGGKRSRRYTYPGQQNPIKYFDGLAVPMDDFAVAGGGSVR
jgi:hypothetical protein